MEMLKILSAIIYYVGLVIVVAFMHKFMWFLCVDIIIKVAYAGGSQWATSGEETIQQKATHVQRSSDFIYRPLFGPRSDGWGMEVGLEFKFELEPALQLHLTLS